MCTIIQIISFISVNPILNIEFFLGLFALLSDIRVRFCIPLQIHDLLLDLEQIKFEFD